MKYLYVEWMKYLILEYSELLHICGEIKDENQIFSVVLQSTHNLFR